MNKITISSIKFVNYKALSDYSINLRAMNILVGPNNCGKSTVISALRILEVALRTARAKSPTRVPTINDEKAPGHNIPENSLPVSLENVHTDYSEEDSYIEFKLSDENKLFLFFPKSGGCFLSWDSQGQPITNPSSFRQNFPIKVQVVPVLGPVEQEETLLADETIKRSLGTNRASRHFRNYWIKYSEGFDKFREMIKATWPGMDIQLPEFSYGRINMYCLENRRTREIYWAGVGFQVWCQLLTHIFRCHEYDLTVIDEPEIYLHPDVQRQLLGVLRDAGPDILLATHSTEILGEADPAEILLMDKAKPTAKRLKDVSGIQQALDSIGSIQNITLAQLARTKKILFVESSDDNKILRRFSRKLNLDKLASGSDIAPLESKGFSSWKEVKSFAWGMKEALQSQIKIAAVYDRDYRCDEEVLEIEKSLREYLTFASLHKRKEIENYFLIPSVLDRLVQKIAKEREQRGGKHIKIDQSCENILETLTSSEKNDIQSQYMARYCEYYKSSRKDPATLNKEALKIFDSKWSGFSTRMEIVPGKETLKALREYIEKKWAITFTDFNIIDEFLVHEIPDDLKQLLKNLESYRQIR